MEWVWTAHQQMMPPNKKEYYEMVKSSRFCDFYCKRYDNKFPITAEEWLNRQPIDTLVEWIDGDIERLLAAEKEGYHVI